MIQAVGPYRLGERLGRGAFSEVYRGRDPQGRSVILKLARDPQFAWMLRQEARFRRRIDHPGILPLLDLRLDTHPPLAVFADVGGRTLRQALREAGPFDAGRAGTILHRLLEVLQAIHRRGGIHRDVKPENVLLLRGDRVMLIDFGLGEFAGRLSRSDYLAHSLSTAADPATGGTLGYLPPEERLGLPPAPSSDLYAAGVLLFEMLTGRMPERLELPEQFLPASPEGIDEFFRRTCCRRQHRYVSTTQALRAAACLAAAGRTGYTGALRLVPLADRDLGYGPILGLKLVDRRLHAACPLADVGPTLVIVDPQALCRLKAQRLPGDWRDRYAQPSRGGVRFCPAPGDRWVYSGDQYGSIRTHAADDLQPIAHLHREPHAAVGGLACDAHALYAGLCDGRLLLLAPARDPRPPVPRRMRRTVYAPPQPRSTVTGGANSLRDLIESPCRRAHALTALRKVVAALAALHTGGQVHGALRPENVRPLAHGALLLSESLPPQPVFERADSLKRSLVTGGARELADATAYRSPNRPPGRTPTLADDCYALATICFELLTGERPDVLERPSDFPDCLPDGVPAGELDRIYGLLVGAPTRKVRRRLEQVARRLDHLCRPRPGLLRRLLGWLRGLTFGRAPVV